MADGGIVTTHQDITEQRRSEAKIAHMALHDTLTGLPNRVLLNERLEQALTRVKRGEMRGRPPARSRPLQDTSTTRSAIPPATSCLTMVADRLRALVRETDTVARMGGDEFAILQVAIAQPADATALAQRIIEAVSEPYDIDGHQVVIGTSVGIAVGPADGMNPDQLIRNADLALYRAKGDGRGTYRFFEPEMDAQMQARRAMEYDLRKALPAGEFELLLPARRRSRDQRDQRLRGADPLAPSREGPGFARRLHPAGRGDRLHRPDRRVGDPAGLRHGRAMAGRPQDRRQPLAGAVPQPGLVQVVVERAGGLGPAARAAGARDHRDASCCRTARRRSPRCIQLRELGVRIAMDDFGTGYSSLSYLQSFPFDKIKIDRSFVKDIADGVGSLNIVRAVAAMANGLGMTTTAEGVETKEQLDTVRAEGCTEMQGFLFSQPLPLIEIERLLWRTAGQSRSEIFGAE